MTITNYHIIQVVAMPATNTLPARVKIVSERYSESKIISYDNDPGDISPAVPTAARHLIAKGFEIIGKGEGKNKMYLISTTFKKFTNE